ncbi:uncharacterized protein [Nicotiana tomentosiformis]|uniref:uncharacterized protein n=1 Tax=Nicotiana tomentosiformis TaxID=4098 RepID=UPI00388CD6F8
MVRTRNTGFDDQTPAPPVGAARGRSQGRGRARGRGRPRSAARAHALAAAEEPPVAPVGEEAPETPVSTPALQKTLAQFLSMFVTLAQAGIIPLAPANSQAAGRAHTTVARTPELRAQVYHAPEVIAVQPIVPVRPKARATVSEGEQLRLQRYKKYHPSTFSGLALENAQSFLEECHCILHTMESGGSCATPENCASNFERKEVICKIFKV